MPNPIYDSAEPPVYDNIQQKAESHCVAPTQATYATVLNTSTTAADHVGHESPSSSVSVIQGKLYLSGSTC